MSADFWAILITGILSVGLTLATQLYWAGKMRGEFGARLKSAETDIGDLKEEQGQQWSKINGQGERISRLEGPSRANGGYRG